MKKQTCPYKILAIIINDERGIEEKIDEILESFNIQKNIVSRANGTAPSTIADFFGFGVTEKSIITTFIPSDKAKEIIQKLTDVLKLEEKNRGIVFTLPLTSMDSRIFKLLEERNEA